MLAVVLSLAASAASPPRIDPHSLAACRPPASQRAAERGREGPRRLGDLPPARHQLTVIRSIDGCFVSTIVRHDAATGERSVIWEPAGRVQAVPTSRR